MALRSLHHVLNLLEQSAWQERQQFQRLTTVWSEVVGATIATQTRPIAIQRQVLQVATSNTVWSQTLAFERVRILDRLNAQLATALVDIRFSPRQWQTEQPAIATPTALLFQMHPCRVEATEPIAHQNSIESTSANQTPTIAFQHWAIAMQTRSQHLPLCPVCDCPTPAGELQRWSMCTHCVVKQW
ncbi:DUF721 domain-containing protein [Microcoleus sp. FACHB-1515]|uniref:DUF721 domain-containing protein n=1 Tax=Cyanophyceae TaxID=3028117 RepID=UPI001682E19B|nr:DciA family protein [Microcoleus sp. FACHB-1515]MBD2090109.1 DUF721 domain-containing protein [Microcoleus sp. FACHB-1515]